VCVCLCVREASKFFQHTFFGSIWKLKSQVNIEHANQYFTNQIIGIESNMFNLTNKQLWPRLVENQSYKGCGNNVIKVFYLD
jgi:hypothetical protein